MRKDVSQFNGQWKVSEKDQLEILLLYSNLSYRTPGGLTLAQMNANPKQARPATAALPSAIEQQAGVYNKSLFAGLTNTYQFSDQWKNVSTVIFNKTDFENPFITNYEKREESGIGLRTRFSWTKDWGGHSLNWTIGGEWQLGNAGIDSTGNIKGVPDNNLVHNDFKSVQQFIYTQLEWTIAKKLLIQAGLSLNNFNYNLERTIPQGVPAKLDYDNQLLPRIAALYKIGEQVSLHASMSKGYSAPTLAEIRPSAGGIHSDLQAEYGWNYETGIKGQALHSRLHFDLALFSFNLENAIVRRTNSAGAEYFINAGGTKQQGVEISADWYAINRNDGLFRQLRLWTAASIFDFTFSDYKVNSNDYSGNDLTGVPSEVILAGADLSLSPGIYFNLTFNYTSSIPLTDQNDVYSQPYRLWHCRIGWKKKWKNGWATDLFAGVDNAADELYSLGNDINAFGRRYYNPAADRNYYGGLRFSF